LLTFLRIRGWEALDYKDDAVDEWRTKTTGQLLLDCSRFATFDAGCRLQMALGVKREGEQRNDGYEDYSGHPETTYTHETDDFIQNRR
jgi:hypothetical protein